MFKNRNYHGLVSLQFLGSRGIFVGLNISVPKNSITKLYKNLSCQTFSAARNVKFGSVSDLITEISF